MEQRPLTRVLDPEGAHLAALRRLGDFERRSVVELGCGDGRLTVGIAADAARVLAFDPDAEAVERARRFLPAELAERVVYRVASGNEIELEPASFGLALFSWHFAEWSLRTSCTSWAIWSGRSSLAAPYSTCR
ncbi:MAG: class I SAM-dependent methyltransferase [Actinobacteria bacterium]|nr:MAG: class I SAM-dependent methyltransferase [Actinomycetota bacterium]